MSQLLLGVGGGVAAAGGYDVFVLAGQSNMIGRYGPVDGALDATDADILQWGFNGQAAVSAADPLDHDGETANTIGLGLTFAKAYKADGRLTGSRKVLLVPVARGGQAISYWAPGGAADLAVIASVNAAMAAGTGTNVLKGILWHQGESDSGRSTASYAADLDALIAHWRTEFDGASASTPFVTGGLLPGGSATDANIVAALQQTPDRLAYTDFASATSLVSGGDNLHFNAASLRTLGGRYFPAWEAAETNAATAPDAVDDLSAAAGDTQVTLSWTAPASGHSAITDYVVEYKLSANSTWLTFSDGTSATPGAVVTGLTNGSAYDFRVFAVNAIGTGAASNVDSETPASSGITPESGAARHWVFGDDNPTMGDLVVGDVLTPVSTTPTHHSGYSSTAGRNAGARSTKASTTGPQTLVVVARIPVATGTMIAGSFGSSAGAGIYASTSAIATFQTRSGAGSNGRVFGTADWNFLVMSWENGTYKLIYQSHPTNPITNTTGSTTAANAGGNLFGIGDAYFNNASYAGGVDVAELIIFDSTKTLTEVEAILARSKTRMAARGITLYAP